MSALTQSPSPETSPSRFVWDDPLLLDGQLTEDERMIRDTARDFAQEKLLPGGMDAYAKETTDPAIFAAMGEIGLLGDSILEMPGIFAVYPANRKPPATVRAAVDFLTERFGGMPPWDHGLPVEV